MALAAELHQRISVDPQTVNHDRIKRLIWQETEVSTVWRPIHLHEPGQGFTERMQSQPWEVYGDETFGELARPHEYDFDFCWVEYRRRFLGLCDFSNDDLHLSPTMAGSIVYGPATLRLS
ncbi:MAG TPA: hypothetical protein VMB73_19650 [Acetobacteraceae bacterium]|nr:hypothetical protein [Acetobacteraceae bacterium]